MGRIFLDHIGGTRLFSCANCDTILTNRSELISTRFTGATGRAFLFNKVRIHLILHLSGMTFDVHSTAPAPFNHLFLHLRWWTSSIARCRTEWCSLEGTWSGMSAARTATANWAGFMSLLPKIVSDTKRAGSFWRERWFERARASKSTSLQTTHEPSDRIIPPPSSHLFCDCTPPPADFAISEVSASPLPHFWFMTTGLCWVDDCFAG